MGANKGAPEHNKQRPKTEREREFGGADGEQRKGHECREEAHGRADQTCAKAQQPIPSGESKVGLLLIRTFGGTQRDVAADGVVEPSERICCGRLCWLGVVLRAASPAELGEVGPKAVFGRLIASQHTDKRQGEEDRLVQQA